MGQNVLRAKRPGDELTKGRNVQKSNAEGVMMWSKYRINTTITGFRRAGFVRMMPSLLKTETQNTSIEVVFDVCVQSIVSRCFDCDVGCSKTNSEFSDKANVLGTQPLEQL